MSSVSLYQRNQWGAKDGETALPEVSAIRARNYLMDVDRISQRDHRIAVIRDRLATSQPEIAVFYGKTCRDIYAQIAQVPFDNNGYAWCGSTLCALVPHPAARSLPSAMNSDNWWVGKGIEMRHLRNAKLLQQGRGFENLQTGGSTHAQPSSLREPHLTQSQDATEPLPTDIIRLLTPTNPKQIGSKSLHRFNCYADGITVEQYRQTVLTRLGPDEARKFKADLQWDSHRGFISLERHGRTIHLAVPQSLQRP